MNHIPVTRIGVVQQLVVGTADRPDTAQGSAVPVPDDRKIIGNQVRTKQDATPVFISPGARWILPRLLPWHCKPLQ